MSGGRNIGVGTLSGLPSDSCRGRRAAGVTLVEVMIASVILVIMGLGTLRCQYHAAVQGRIARAQLAASRVAQLLLEDWKSTGGSTEYDPARLGLGFSGAQSIPSGFTTAEGLGSALNDAVYAIKLDGIPVLVMLKYLDAIKDSETGAILRQLAVVIRFDVEYVGGSKDGDRRLADMAPINLVTYTRVDAAGG